MWLPNRLSLERAIDEASMEGSEVDVDKQGIFGRILADSEMPASTIHTPRMWKNLSGNLRESWL